MFVVAIQRYGAQLKNGQEEPATASDYSGNANDYSGNMNNGVPTNVVYTSQWTSGYTPP